LEDVAMPCIVTETHRTLTGQGTGHDHLYAEITMCRARMSDRARIEAF
jgi:hypothetical protein